MKTYNVIAGSAVSYFLTSRDKNLYQVICDFLEKLKNRNLFTIGCIDEINLYRSYAEFEKLLGEKRRIDLSQLEGLENQFFLIQNSLELLPMAEGVKYKILILRADLEKATENLLQSHSNPLNSPIEFLKIGDKRLIDKIDSSCPYVRRNDYLEVSIQELDQKIDEIENFFKN